MKSPCANRHGDILKKNKIMKKLIMAAWAFLSLATAQAQQLPMREYVDQLMSKMTLQEKIGQLNLQVAGDITTGSAQTTEVSELIAAGKLGGVFNLKGADKIRALQQLAVKKSRLGIPLLVGMDVIHGYETIFPIPLGMSCSWDVQAVENAARIAAKEATADGIDWVYSPMVDIALDPRWGRIAEGNGEDPFLGGEMAKAYVRGYQGDYSKNSNVMACLKHYALYGAVEAGRDYNTVDMSHLRMYNQYFPPYKAAVEAGVGSVMTSFNLVDGIPATANSWLINDVLRKEWKFDGFVVTDYGSIGEMTNHGIGDMTHNSVLALKAGTDMDMCAQGFLKTLEASLKAGRVTEAEIDAACRRVLEAKYKLGLFANPYKYCDSKRRAKDIYTAENRQASRDLAAESFVLLKNQDNILPLKKQGRIALIGPLANDRANMAGSWCVAYTPDRYATLKEGLERAVAGKAQILYAQGCNICADSATQVAGECGKNILRGNDAEMKAEALRVAKEADVIVCAMGETADMSGESSSRANLEMPDVQLQLLAELQQLGKPVVLLHFSGRPTLLTWEQAHLNAIMNVWFGGSETADAIADVLFGDKVPSGKLTTTFPQAMGQIPLYYNHLNTGRPVAEGAGSYQKYASNYLDVRNDALYPFGYGLSYTTFKYGAPQLSSTTMAQNDSVTATVAVTNTGSRDADEIVQLYIHDRFASIARPVKELKAFRRIHLKASETQQVVFAIRPDMLKFYNSDLHFVLEPGDFDIMTGPNSRDTQGCQLTVEE
jgi:beta-glucosidase